MKLFGYPVEEVNSGTLIGGDIRFGDLDDYNKTTYDRENWWTTNKDGRFEQITVNHLRLGTKGPLFDLQNYRYIRVDTFKLTVEGGHSSDGPWTMLEAEPEST